MVSIDSLLVFIDSHLVYADTSLVYADSLVVYADTLLVYADTLLVSIDSLVVFTGAFTPEAFKDSDADFNIGMALGALQSLPTTGNSRVYIAMNGQ